MTFAMTVKEEVTNLPFSKDEIKYFLIGFIKHNGELIISNGQIKLKVTTLSSKVASKLFSWIKQFLIGDIELSIVQGFKLNKHKIFTLTCIGNVEKMLIDLGIYKEYNISTNSNIELVENKDHLRSYIAGCFVSVGSVNAPTTTNYHLEMQTKDFESSQSITLILEKFGFSFKILQRKNKFVLYVKKSLYVSDFLKLIGATSSVMNFEVIRIDRDLNNSLNRMNNIDLSNHVKTIRTGEKQINSINYIKEKGFFTSLSIKAQKLAEYRIDNPELSYSELSEELEANNIFISKPGISNLFKKITELAKDLGEK